MAEQELDFSKLSRDMLPGLRAYAEQVSKTLERVRGGFDDMRKEMNAVKATTKSPDGYVTVTVGPRGQLVKLELDPRIYRKPDATKLAATITETIQKAAVEANKKIEEVTERYAPGMGVAEQTRGEFKPRTGRFDFITDQLDELRGGNER